MKLEYSRFFIIEEQGDITSIKEFMESLFNLRDSINNSKLWYRGQSKYNYKLIPSIGRIHEYLGISCPLVMKQEKDLLHRFRRRIAAKLDRLITPGEAMFLARHVRWECCSCIKGLTIKCRLGGPPHR